MKLHTASNDRLEVEPEALTAILTIWTKGEPVRSVKLYETEIDWLIKGLDACKVQLQAKPQESGDKLL